MGTVAWRFTIPSGSADPFIALVVGNEGTLYFGCYSHFPYQNPPRYLFALRPDGSLYWQKELGTQGEIIGPLVLSAGNVQVVVGKYASLYTFAPDGSLLSMAPTGIVYLESPSPGVGLDGTLYLVHPEGKCYALEPSGNIRWSTQLKDTYGWFPSVAVSPSGALLYASGPDASRSASLVAVQAGSGALLWEAPSSRYSSPPVVDSEGNVYYTRLREQTGFVLCSLTEEGTLRWESKEAVRGNSNLALAADGAIYACGENNSLLCFDCEGHLRWRVPFGVDAPPQPGVLVIDERGTAYVFLSTHLVAFDRSGRALFACPLPSVDSPLAAALAEARVYLLGENTVLCVE